MQTQIGLVKKTKNKKTLMQTLPAYLTWLFFGGWEGCKAHIENILEAKKEHSNLSRKGSGPLLLPGIRNNQKVILLGEMPATCPLSSGNPCRRIYHEYKSPKTSFENILN